MKLLASPAGPLCLWVASCAAAFCVSEHHPRPHSVGFAPRGGRSSASTAAISTAESLLRIPRSGGSAAGSPLALASTTATLKNPKDLYDGAVVAGTNKAKATFAKIFQLGVVSGAHIGFGAYLAMTVGGACPQLAASNPGLQKIVLGAFGLPFGLIMTLVTGGELFTGNTALVTAARQEGKITTKELAKNWVASYLGNFVGSLLLAYLAYKSGTLGDGPAAVAMATSKCSLAWDVAFVRGILCNWLVCMAVYMASGCSTMIGKMTAVWFPISAFVALGLDHSVANMFILPLGMMRGASISAADALWKNLVPVTLGNIVGGAACVMMPFGVNFGSWFQTKSKPQ